MVLVAAALATVLSQNPVERAPAINRRICPSEERQVDACLDISDTAGRVLSPGNYWVTDSEGASLSLLELPEAAPAGSLEPILKQMIRVPLSVDYPRSALEDDRVAFEIKMGTKSWRTNQSLRDLSRTKYLFLPRGEYSYRLFSPLIEEVSGKLRADDGDSTLRLLVARLPLIQGSIRSVSGKRLIRTEIDLLDGRRYKLEDPGEFSLPMGGPWPEQLVVRSEGFGVKAVGIPPKRRDVRLPDVELESERFMTLHFDLSEPTAAELSLIREKSSPLVHRFDLPAGISEKTIPLSAEPHRLLLSGDSAFERFGVVLKADPDPDTVGVRYVRIEPFEISMRSVTDAGRPKPLAAIHAHKKNAPEWYSSETSSESISSIKRTFWQPGEYLFMVQIGGSAAPFPFEEKLSGGDAEVVFQMPDSGLEISLKDADTARPVMNAEVLLRTTHSKGQTLLRKPTDADGRITFDPVNAGEHDLQVVAEGFVDYRETFRTNGTGGVQKRSISLVPATVVVARIQDRRGAALSGVSGVHLESIQPALSDVQGLIRLQTPKNTQRKFWFISRDGSFTWQNFSASAGRPIVVMPPSEASIVLRFEDEAGRPLPNFGIVIRYEGAVIPPRVTELMSELSGRRFISDVRGTISLEAMPPGTYEFYPVYPGHRDPERGAQPTRIAVQSGTNEVKLTFERAAE